MDNIPTPVNSEALQDLLVKTNYSTTETEFLVNGFKNGSSLEYEGPEDRRDKSQNIPSTQGVGNKEELWIKVMKEVKLMEVKLMVKLMVYQPLGGERHSF